MKGIKNKINYPSGPRPRRQDPKLAFGGSQKLKIKMKDSVRVARNPVELFSTIPPEIKNIHSHKIFIMVSRKFHKIFI